MYSIVLMVALSGGTELPDHWGCGCGGGHSYWGGCYGGWGGCYGGWGGCYGGWGGCGGGYGYGWSGGYPYGWGYSGYSNYAPTYYSATSANYAPVATSAKSDRARVLVHVPEGARLTVNGVATKSTGADRVFVSPLLQAGGQYRYTLKAEAIRNGQKVTASKTVTILPGKKTEVTISLPEAGVAKR